MNRRTALKNCFIITVGTAIIPACMQEKSKSTLGLKQLDVSDEQAAMMAELSEMIIPKTDTPGAKDVGAHLFALTMVDDCYKPEDQKKFTAGASAFEALSKKTFSKKFLDLSAAERIQLLTDLEAKKDDKENEAAAFYKTYKGLTLQGYTNSKYYLTKVRVYEMVPGRFHGCVPVKTVKA